MDTYPGRQSVHAHLGPCMGKATIFFLCVAVSYAGAPSMAIGHQQRYVQSLTKPRRGFKTIPSQYSQPQPSAQPHPAFPRGTVTQHHPQWGHPTYQAQPHGVQLSTQPQGVQQFAQPQGVQPFAQPQGGPTLTQAHPLLEPLGQQFQMQVQYSKKTRQYIYALFIRPLCILT